MSTTKNTAVESTADDVVAGPKKFIITTAIYVEADNGDAAEQMLNAALDNLANSGGDVRGHEIVETRDVTNDY